MEKNMGKIDRIFRAVLGVVILAVGYYYHSWWGLIGLIPLVTAFISWCPAYYPFKFSTIASKKPADK